MCPEAWCLWMPSVLFYDEMVSVEGVCLIIGEYFMHLERVPCAERLQYLSYIAVGGSEGELKVVVLFYGF